MARLRSRINWLRDGDANTKLFHLHARHRKRKNFIGKIVSGEHICTSHEDKAAAIDVFYENLLGKCDDREYTINLFELEIISHDFADLELPFSEEEVWNTIKMLPSDKAPGPDGFTGRFYKACWPIIMSSVSILCLEIEVLSTKWTLKKNFDKYFAFSQLNLDKMDNNSVKSNDLWQLIFHSTTLLNIALGLCSLWL